MVDSFLGIVQDVAAAPEARRTAALKIAQTLLPKIAKKTKVHPDEYGFRINPNLARLYRDTVGEARSIARKQSRRIPANAEKLKKLQALADALLRRVELPCPTIYGEKQKAKDCARLIQLLELRGEKEGLSKEEDAEEAHLRVRVEAFYAGPQRAPRERCQALEDAEDRFKKSRLFGGAYAPPLSHRARRELKLLRWLYPKPTPPLLSTGDDEFSNVYCFHPFYELPAEDGNLYPEDSKLRPSKPRDLEKQ
jgi:hypothetical protein